MYYDLNDIISDEKQDWSSYRRHYGGSEVVSIMSKIAEVFRRDFSIHLFDLFELLSRGLSPDELLGNSKRGTICSLY